MARDYKKDSLHSHRKSHSKKAKQPRRLSGSPVFSDEKTTKGLFYQLDQKSRQLKRLYPFEHHSTTEDDVKNNPNLEDLLTSAELQLNQLHKSLSDKGIKFAASDQKHFDDIVLLLQRAKEFGAPSKEITIKFFNDILEFFIKKCEDFKKPFLKLGNERHPIKHVLNVKTDEHHYTRGLGSILKNFMDDAERNKIIKDELEINLNELLNPYDMYLLKINTVLPKKHKTPPKNKE